MDTVKKLQDLPTKTEGIFVMPRDRITIFSTFVVSEDELLDTTGSTKVLYRDDAAVVWGNRQVSTRAHPMLHSAVLTVTACGRGVKYCMFP